MNSPTAASTDFNGKYRQRAGSSRDFSGIAHHAGLALAIVGNGPEDWRGSGSLAKTGAGETEPNWRPEQRVRVAPSHLSSPLLVAQVSLPPVLSSVILDRICLAFPP
jgi:hypothetical protein